MDRHARASVRSTRVHLNASVSSTARSRLGRVQSVRDAATGQIKYVTDPATGRPIDYASGNPVANLDLVRSIFFAHPGRTLGRGELRVLSQAQCRTGCTPTDAR